MNLAVHTFTTFTLIYGLHHCFSFNFWFGFHLFSSMVLEDDVFVAKLPTFEKRCETPAGNIHYAAEWKSLFILTYTLTLLTPH